MEGKRVLVLNMVMLVALVSLFAASARDLFVGLPLGDPNATGQQGLDCCDDCRCDGAGYCNCQDWTQWSCNYGCYNCQCDRRQRPTMCRCVDWLDSCPRTCMYWRSKDDGAGEAAQKGDASRHA